MDKTIEQSAIREVLETIKGMAQTAFFDDKNLWTVKRCAAFLGYSEAHFRNRIACRVDFPRPINLPTEGKGASLRYKPEEVKRWADKQKAARRLLFIFWYFVSYKAYIHNHP